MNYCKLTVLTAATLLCFKAYGQTKNLAEKLGYPKDGKLLIIHADDAGLSHAADSAIIIAFEKGNINSASIMAPCPWFPEIAGYAKRHPEFDWGIHITLTSEWKNYKWAGAAPANEIASLLNKDGYLYTTNEEFKKYAKPMEIEREIKAQIDKALSYGIKLTHIDNHMGSILASPEMIAIYQKVGKEYGLPVLIPMNLMRIMAPGLLSYVDTTGVLVKNYVSAYNAVPAGKWKEFYNKNLQNLKPGLNELIFHLAFNGDEMKAVATGHRDFGSEWRQRDFDYAVSDDFKALLKKDGIYLVTWGDIKKAGYGN